MCCMTIFPYGTDAQRIAIGLGSKLKRGLFGGGDTNSGGSSLLIKPNNNNKQGEDNEDIGDTNNGMILETLKMIVTEKPGVALTMLVALVGYIYLFLFQGRKINNIEQTLTSGGGSTNGDGGECLPIPCLPTEVVALFKRNDMRTF